MAKNRNFKLIGLTILTLILALAPASLSAGPPRPIEEAPSFVAGEILVQVDPGISLPEVAQAVGAKVERSTGDGTIQVLVLQDGSVPAAVQILKTMPGVVFAEPNWLRQLHDAPDDDGYYLKWDLNNDGSLCDGSDCATADADMDWQEAYTSLGSDFSGSAVVAVIDTGIDFNHPDLDIKITSGYDFLDGDSDPTDTYGHGTHVAGIALAETNNGTASDDTDTAGVGYSPNIQVMPLRVCDENGCPTSAIVDAIYYAADNEANVINLSLGGKIGSSSEEQAINYAWGKGLVIAASSGNDGAGRVSYPAAFANCIAVGSTNWHDQLAPYSNKGKDLDVVAPGGDMSSYHDPGGIYSTMPTYDVYLTTGSYSYSKDYDQLQGTSMAAPQVSGLAGLLFAIGVTDADGDGNTNDEIRDIIESTADDLGSPGWDREYGWGRINLCEAVGGTECDGPVDNPPSVSIVDPFEGQTVSGTYRVLVSASDDSAVTLVELSIDGGKYIDITTNIDDTHYFYDWDTTTVPDGGHTLKARATDDAGQTTDSAVVNVTVENEPGAEVTVTAIDPNSMQAGTTIPVTITGSGFVSAADVTFENGSGPAPTVSDVVVVNDGTITATVTAKSGGPPKDRVWDVRVTNPDGSSGVLVDGFTVTP